MNYTDTSTFKKTIATLRLFESKGLTFKIHAEGEVYESSNPLPELKHVRTRKNIRRTVCLTDLFRDQIDSLEVAEVAVLPLPPAYADEVELVAWRRAVTSYAVRRFGAKSCSSTITPDGIEILRER